jgi:FG-GAP-like repeat
VNKRFSGLLKEKKMSRLVARSIRAVAAFFLTAIAVPQVPGQTFANASFELPVLSAGTYSSAPPLAGSSWAFFGSTGSRGISTNGSAYTGLTANTAAGNQVAYIQGSGGFYQQVSFPVAGSYVLSFRAIQRFENTNSGGVSLTLQIDGATIGGVVTPPSTGYAQFQTAAFSVSAGSHEVYVIGTNNYPGNDNTVFVDDIRFVRHTDFNGDGRSDLLFRDSPNGHTFAYLVNGTTFSANGTISADTDWAVAHIGDFNGDGKSDLIARNYGTGAAWGQTAIWMMDGASIPTATIVYADPNWVVTQIGDFNGDGQSDLVWTNSESGQTAIWLMNGTSSTSSTTFTDANWVVTHVGDLNGDGKSDLVWRNTTDGSTALWTMNGLSSIASAGASSDPSWAVRDLGDFNGDGKADLLWTHTSGALAIWLMNGLSPASSAVISSDPQWKVTNVGDFNGDGKGDIMWRSAAGATAIWLMNGTTVVNSAITSTDPSWFVVQLGDFNGDGKSDIAWLSRGSAQTVVALMNGTTQLSSGEVATNLVPVSRLPEGRATPAVEQTYYGYFGGDDVPAAARHMSLLHEGMWGNWCNASGLTDLRIKALRKLVDARNHGVPSAMVWLDAFIYVGNGTLCQGIPVTSRGTSTIQANLKQLFRLLQANGVLDMTVALYPVDEPDVSGLSAGTVGAVNSTIRAIAAGYPELQGVKLAAFYGDNINNHPGREHYDWVGFDDYGAGASILAPGGKYDQFRALLTPAQRTMLIPGGTDETGRADPGPFTAKVLSDTKAVALVPFLWTTATGIGVNGMATIYCQAGAQVKQVSPEPCPN